MVGGAGTGNGVCTIRLILTLPPKVLRYVHIVFQQITTSIVK